MDNQAETLTPEESLQVITSMIEKAKTTVADNSFYFLLWGWLVLIGAIGQYVLKVIVKTERHPEIWYIMFIGVVASVIYRRRERRIRRVKTYVNEGLRNIWTVVGIAQVLIIFIFSRQGDWEHCYTIFILTYSIGCYLTGRLLRFNPLVWGAALCWVLAILTTYSDFDTNILLLAAAILGSYIIPGYLLRKQYQHQLRAK